VERGAEMNCSECIEKLVEYIEGLLPEGQKQAVEAHLRDCQRCRTELQEITSLGKRITSDAKSKQLADFEDAVLNRIIREQHLKLKQADRLSRQPNIWRIIMKNRITKFAVAAAIIIAAALTVNTFHKSIPVISTASAAQVLTEAAKAVEDVRSIHIKAKMRLDSGVICLECDFVPIEMWKKLDNAGILRWRIEEPGEVIVADGNSQINFMGPNSAAKFAPGKGPFPWYGHLMNVDKLIDRALKQTMNRSDAGMCMRHEVLKEGAELVIEIEAAAEGDYTNDYLKNTSFCESDHKMIYRFDSETKLLKGFEFYVHTDKEDVLVFEVTDIEYNLEIDNGLFTLELPQDVIWFEEPKTLADNEKYQQMTPKEVARAFFQASADENWNEFLKFWPMSAMDEKLKSYLGGLEIISIGEPFKSGLYPGWFVPYEIRFKNGRVQKHNLAVRNDNPAGRYVVDGGF
jgi:outer membrane lipoprotein-sorting protein